MIVRRDVLRLALLAPLFGAGPLRGRAQAFRPSRAVLVAGEGLQEPFGVDFDQAGRTYIVEHAGNRVRVLERDGALRLVAGTGDQQREPA